MSDVTITVLGSGTSMGVPTLGCDCAVCHSTDPRDNRLRPSIMVQYSGRTVLIDTTPDFRQQALRERIPRIDAILFTHSHADHIMGLDDLRVGLLGTFLALGIGAGSLTAGRLSG